MALFRPAISRKQLVNLLTKSTFIQTTTFSTHRLHSQTSPLIDAQKTLDWPKTYSRLGSGLKNYSVSSYGKGLEIDSENEGLKSAKLALERTNYSQKQKDLVNAFTSTKSTQQLLETYEEMETCFDQERLAFECFTLVRTLVQQNRCEDAKIFSTKANKILLGNEKCSSGNPCSLDDNSKFLLAKVCTMWGSSCLQSKEYDNSLQYLNLANTILTAEFENDEASVCEGKCVLRALALNEYQRYRVTGLMGKVGESALHAKKCLEVKEKFMEESCHDLGLANMDVFFAYTSAMMGNEALPYGWKAVEIHTKNLGSDHLEVAKMRNNLAFAYRQVGEHEKAREQDELAQTVIQAPESPDEMIEAGKYEEAIAVLKGNVSRDDVKEEARGAGFVSMGKAFYKMGKYSDAKKHLKSGMEILEKCPGTFNRGLFIMTFLGISGLYMKMNDTEAALSLLKKVLAFSDLPQHIFTQAALSYLSFVSESDKAKAEIPYMLDLVEKLKLISGPQHCDVGYGCGHLGVAYWTSGQQELGVKFMEDAKSILDSTIGPNHINSLKASHALSEFYGRMGRYALALEILGKVVEGLKGLPPSEVGFMHQVKKHLSKMKERVAKRP